MVYMLRTPNVASFQLRYVGPDGEIDATTLVQSLSGLSKVMYAVNAHIGNGTKIDIKIRAFREGSFVVDLDILESISKSVTTIFSDAKTELAATVIGTTMLAFARFKDVQGHYRRIEEGKEEETFTINGKTYPIHSDIPGLFHDPDVIGGIKQTSQSIVSDPAVDRFQFLDDVKLSEINPIIEISRDDAASIIEGIQEDQKGVTTNVADKVTTERVELGLYNIKFVTKSAKWEFNYGGTRIQATMEDGNFVEKVSNGSERFGATDKLDVDLVTVQQWNDVNKFYEVKQYRVTKVYQHITLDQMTLDFS